MAMIRTLQMNRKFVRESATIIFPKNRIKYTVVPVLDDRPFSDNGLLRDAVLHWSKLSSKSNLYLIKKKAVAYAKLVRQQ